MMKSSAVTGRSQRANARSSGNVASFRAWYRVEVLKQKDFGPYKPGGTKVGSSLVNGEQSGANFISPAALACAFEKLAEKENENRDITIDRHRLFNNMLSSQPMCFNLFADLRVGVQHEYANAGQVLAAIFDKPLDSAVYKVEIEMLPQPKENYIWDKTAFDAAVFFKEGNGKRSLVSIETKYTDKLAGNAAAQEQRQRQIAEELKLFNKDGQDWYAKNPFDQVIRNLLLTLVYGKQDGLESAINYVLAPEGDCETPELIKILQKRLSDQYCDSIKFLTLETVVIRGLGAAEALYAELLFKFHRRYLGFGQIQYLLP